MNLQDMVTALDRIGQNSRQHSCALGMVGNLQTEDETVKLAMELLRALQQAGAKTTGEAFALLRIYPMLMHRDKALERQAAESKRVLGQLAEKERILQSLLGAALSIANMPCGPGPETMGR